MFNSFYKGKRVLVTGHTGFKGGWLSLWLKKLGAAVSGVSLPPPSAPSLHELITAHAFADQVTCDIRDLESLAAAVKKIQPEVISIWPLNPWWAGLMRNRWPRFKPTPWAP